MAYNDRFSDRKWTEETRCLGCFTNLGLVADLFCSEACEDLHETRRIVVDRDLEDDCYA